MSRRQLVFYNKSNGLVLKTASGGSITKRSQISNYLPTIPTPLVGFYYEHDDAEILPNKDLVLFLHNGLPPYLCDSNRIPKTIHRNIERNRRIVLNQKKIKTDFEYGMGDQIMQLEVYKKFTKELPNIDLIAGVDPIYKNIYTYLSPKPRLVPWGHIPEFSDYFRFELNHNHILWDPRGGTFGKACLFGAELGLPEVHEQIEFKMSPQEILSWSAMAGVNFTKTPSPILGIHIHCNSRVTSNWPLPHAITLADLWHKKTNGSVIFLGDPKRIPFAAPWAFFQSFPCDWASTGAIIQNLNLLVAVDSGPMHLGRAAQINQIFLWGGSGPMDILGRHPQWNDAIGKIECANSICATCPTGNPRCINDTTAYDIWKIIDSGGFPQWTHNPYLI